jgi:glycosyltransferase involved in cell wall biosynthesis
MKIAILTVGKKRYGGRVYGEIIKKVLSKHFLVKEIHISREKKSFYLRLPILFWKLRKISSAKEYNIIIRNFDLNFFLHKKPTRNIIIVHHIDYSFSPFLIKTFFFIFSPLIFNNLKKVNAIVVVSKYWEKFFKKRGYKNVFLIYNAFNLKDFEISEKEIEDFKKKYNLIGKPIVYIGNCQKAKGVIESYRALKNLNCYLVTSGKPQVKIPARNFELEYRDYLKLLKASSVVVTMSLFKEGWCRTAHEAMLCKRPVIGSGKGGMRELLEGGKQMICEDFSKLREKVEYLLKNPQIREKMGQDGYNFARNFTLERFEKDWLNLIQKLS